MKSKSTISANAKKIKLLAEFILKYNKLRRQELLENAIYYEMNRPRWFKFMRPATREAAKKQIQFWDTYPPEHETYGRYYDDPLAHSILSAVKAMGEDSTVHLSLDDASRIGDWEMKFHAVYNQNPMKALETYGIDRTLV